MLRARHERKCRVDAHAIAREVSRVVEERRGDLATVSGEVRLADRSDAALVIDEDLDGGHRARFFVRLPARSRPMSLLRGGSIASTAWSSTPSARSTWTTLRKLTPGSPGLDLAQGIAGDVGTLGDLLGGEAQHHTPAAHVLAEGDDLSVDLVPGHHAPFIYDGNRRHTSLL